MILDALFALAALATALWLRPWRGHGAEHLPWPWLAWWALMPLLWGVDRLTGAQAVQPMSGAALLVLMAGWPLAVLGLVPVALVTLSLGSIDAAEALHRLVWLGLVPATLALGLGALVRRLLPLHLMVYIIGRGFFATWAAAGLSGSAALLLALPEGSGLGLDDLMLARWLSASGEAVLTGMAVSIFVAFRPHWLATYTDRLYLPRS